MKIGISRNTIIILSITGFAVLLYTGFEIFWNLNPSTHITQKAVVPLPSSLNFDVVDEVWKSKSLKEFSYKD